ncbi:hypothetical protein F5X68DRAFT_274067 [Plectosphaerella plurivora]|uniref:Infection structure specific protein n=1 Tax=Plectosphaerella plurivora TaxID=936078 RepID=A0A9P8VIN5_9PEZI|nr:hypothetical protein F5X68DRAFT_274067 [Plectosphaerella plurivora]
MRTSPLILSMAASAAATLVAERQAPEPTPAPTLAIPSIDPTCASALETILPRLADAPLPDPTLIPFIAGQGWETMTDYCSPPKVTGDPSMVAGWSSYLSSVSSFYSEHTSDISALAAACTGDSSVADQFPLVPGDCGGGSGSGSGDGKNEGSGQGGSGGGSGGGTGNSNGDKGNQGSSMSVQREVILMAAMAAVGMVFVGVY